MPLTKKGQKIKASMEKTYGAKKGKQVFYASENKGTIKGIAKKKRGDEGVVIVELILIAILVAPIVMALLA